MHILQRIKYGVRARLSALLLTYTPVKATRYYTISDSPVIITVFMRHLYELGLFFKIFKKKTAYFFCMIKWSKNSELHARNISMQRRRYKKMYPLQEIIYLCNTRREYELFGKHKVPRIFCNQNVFVDEKIFNITPEEPKSYAAVYNAQPYPFKRHYLVKEIKEPAFIIYNLSKDNNRYFNKLKQDFGDAKWLNFVSGSYRYLSGSMVSKYLNQARVGLCLSKLEGAMYASMEYLLCGLPVVSTRSEGGRDVFFDDDYVKIVDDNPGAVRKGVEEMIGRDIPADYIRSKTLEKIKTHRSRFIDLVQNIYDKEQVDKNFRAEWGKIFFHKMHRKDKIEDALSRF